MTGLTPSPHHLRAEIARHQLDRQTVCEPIGMNENLLSNYLNESRTLPHWAAHNIGYAINRTTGIRVFDVEMDLGVLPSQRELRETRTARPSVRLPVPPKRRRRTRKN